MFEKEAEDNKPPYAFCSIVTDCELWKDGFQKGAEFGYNKAFVEADKNLKAIVADFNKEKCELLGIIQGKDKVIQELKKELNKVKEWHYVKDGDYPKKKGIYLVAWKRTHHVEEFGEWGFDVDVFNADEGYFEGDGDFVIAWKEIVLPKENS